MDNNNDAALSSFIARKASIDAMIAKLAALSEDHFNVMPDEVRYGRVVSLVAIERMLTDCLELIA